MTSKRVLLAGTALLLALAASGCAGQQPKNPSGAENGKSAQKNESKAQKSGEGRPILQGGNETQGKSQAQSGGRMQAKSNQAQPSKLQVTDKEATIGLQQIDGKPYVSLRDLLGPVGYQMRLSDDGREVMIGGTDPLYKIGLDSAKAERDGQTIMLDEPAKRKGDDVLIPESALGDLFQEDIRYTNGGSDIKLSPLSEDGESMRDLEKADVSEEIGGQQQSEEKQGGGPIVIEGEEDGDGMRIQAAGLPNIDIDAMIQTAMKYRGVPYLFGAGPYTRTKRFDCSSFTQYVFAKYGIKLRRVSYNQATQGIFVSKANLRRGDLVFFSVPGRFKSDKKVGHVGIYIGSGQMIHTFSTNSGGVHISSIKSGTWARRYLRARRVAT
ncbi:C40 family peptidase [Paenibacillus xanthanilyticus]|uniref:NlpC/P60 family protein n=1 Tax=Paenibacillus xanthanilyticus TaxID=1783531 RepID=A0ABV8K1P5_9BACL